MSLMRCARCERMYSLADDEAHPCRYHPGHFRGWYSCCKDPIRGSPGCRSGPHIEDVAMTALMDSFACQPVQASTQMNFIPEAADSEPPQTTVIIFEQPGGALEVGEQTTLTMSDAPPTPAETHASAEAQPPPQAGAEGAAVGADERTTTMPYVVGVHDTFASVSMRHKMSETELLQLNQLKRRQVRPGDVLLVYVERSSAPTEDDLRKQMVRKFRRENRCSLGEAVYYLETSEYDMAAAVAERRKDLEWEREQQQARDAVAAQSLQEKDATDDAPSGQQGAKRANGPHPLLRCFTQCYPAAPDLRAAHSIVLE